MPRPKPPLSFGHGGRGPLDKLRRGRGRGRCTDAPGFHRSGAGGHIAKAGPASLAAMGRAFIDPGGVGDMADVYYGAIQELTLLFPFAGADQVMGYAMAHELGHLLIGEGHRPAGLMRAAWSKKELDALKPSPTEVQ